MTARPGQPAARRWSPARSTSPTSPAATSSSRRCSRTSPSSSRSSATSRRSSAPRPCSPPTPRRCRSPPWPRALEHPERVVGFHFFNPVAVMPLLEIARTDLTDDAAYATAFAVGKALKKTCIAVRDAPGFVVNRLFMRMFNEVTRAIDEGTPFDVADHALDPLGLPMTPLQLICFTGTAVTHHVMVVAARAVPGPVHRLRQPGPARRRRRCARLHRPDGTLDPKATALYEVGNAPSTGRARSTAGRSRRWPTRSAGCSTKASYASRRRSTLPSSPAAATRSTSAASRPTSTGTGVSERVTGRRFLPDGVANGPAACRPGQLNHPFGLSTGLSPRSGLRVGSG